ncbi:2'-hydroxyisoflavone reductase [Phycisphaerales bacterium]|nr:2'-hydroxyisoflavone reductase [Phycisphaerales bacterium]
MRTTRREFLQASLAASAALAVSPMAFAHPGRANLRILILGGTGFLGPAIVEDAQKRGHDLTLFNRGRREKTKGTSFDGVTKLHGNRDPEKFAEDPKSEGPKGLSEIEEAIKGGAKWDAVIDTSGYYPRIVKASAEMLAPAAGMYCFISSVSVYKSNDKANEDESAEVGKLADPTVETMGAQFENYGPLKALCEQAAEAAFPRRALNIRPGYIVGVRDDSDRFTYWPVRTSQGGTMLVPGDSKDPVQFVDVRDLAAFILNCIERKTTGVFNVTGPAKACAWGEVIGACDQATRAVGKSPAEKVWISAEDLEKLGPDEGVDFPIWIPPKGEYTGFHTRSIAKAVAAGLTTRPAAATCEEILRWWPGEIGRRTRVTKEMQDKAEADGKPAPQMPDPSRVKTGPTPQREAEVIAKVRAAKEEKK